MSKRKIPVFVLIQFKSLATELTSKPEYKVVEWFHCIFCIHSIFLLPLVCVTATILLRTRVQSHYPKFILLAPSHLEGS